MQKKSLKILYILSIAFASFEAQAACPLYTSEPLFNCSSYEINLPLIINNTTLSPSLLIPQGKIGLGTNNPMAALDIQSDGNDVYDTQLIISNPNISNNSTASINAYSADEHRGSLWFMKDNANQGTFFGISTTDSNSQLKERLRISPSGNVGIGTIIPNSALEVAGTIRADIICDRDGNNCKQINTGWGSGGGSGPGTVTQVNTGTGLIGGPILTSGTISVDVGTTANKIVQLDSTGKLPPLDGSNLTNTNATSLNGNAFSIFGATLNQILSFNGTSWTNKDLQVSDINGLATSLGNKIDVGNMPASCAPNQTLTFSSPLGSWSCSDITITPSSFGNQAEGMFLAGPASSAGSASFRKITLDDLPAGVGAGSSPWTELSGNIYRTTGNVGIGTTSPTSLLHLSKILQSSNSYIFNNSDLTYSPTTSPLPDTEIVASQSRIKGTSNISAIDTKIIATKGSIDILTPFMGGDASSGNFEILQNPMTSLENIVGVGSLIKTSANAYANSIEGVQSQALLNGQTPAAKSYRGLIYNLGSGNISSAIGYSSVVGNIGSGSIGEAVGFESAILNSLFPSGPIMNSAKGINISILGQNIANAYGLYIGELSGTSKWGIYQSDLTAKNFLNGSVGIGTNTPTARLEVAGAIHADRICNRSGGNCLNLVYGNPSLAKSTESLERLIENQNRIIQELKSKNSSLEERLDKIESNLSIRKISNR